LDGWTTPIVDENCSAALNGTHQFWFLLMMVTYWMEAYTIKNDTEALVVVFKEACLDVSAEETKLWSYLVDCRTVMV
jgi:hypothetical protein